MRATLRSIPGFDLFAALDAHAGLFDRHGGHAMAAGFSAPARNLEAILKALEAAASGTPGLGQPQALEIDAEVAFSDLDGELWSFVERMAPFGEGNPAPVFLTRGLMPGQVSAVAAGGDHLRLVLQDPDRPSTPGSEAGTGTSGLSTGFRAVGFGLGKADLGAGLVDAAYSLRNNYWRGRKQKELELKGIRPSTQASA